MDMLLSEIQYFPPITFFKSSYGQTHIYLSQYEIYRKTSFRNRCLIAGANGIISLSVPLQHGRNQQAPMHAVKIAWSEPWQSQHWKSIRSAYNRSPFFDHYCDDLDLLFSRKPERLMDWNLGCLKWVMDKLGWAIPVRLTDSPEQESAPGLWEDHRNEVLPKNHGLFVPLKYRQVFEERTGFLPNLSILDLLFNRGKEAGILLGS
ncbi:MAG: WbqC family protein [Bacteroidota bacterium]|nr:WbqC family protein [Bacteroidota bacterium]